MVMYVNSNAGRGFLKAILIVGFLVAILYFISYNKWADHDFDKVDITYKITDEEGNPVETTKKEVEDASKEYEKIYSSINYELMQFNFGEEFKDIYYGNKDFNDEFYIYLGIINIIQNDLLINCNYETVLPKDTIKQKVTSLIGDIKYTDKSFKISDKVVIDYDSSNGNYSIKLNGTCSGFDYSSGGIKNIFKKAEIDGDNLYIYEKALYIENKKDNNGNIIFIYHKDINKDSEVLANSFEKVDQEVLPTYVYKFVKNNNQFVLKEIVKK